MSERAERFDVCSVVVSHLPYDARVWKQARSLASSGRRVRLIGLNYDLDATLVREQDGVSSIEHPFGERGNASSLHRARLLARLSWSVLKTRADVYHCHNFHPGIAVLAAARLRRARIVYDAHELYGGFRRPESFRERISARLLRLAESVMSRAADAVVTTNASRAKVLEEWYGLERVHVVANVPALVDPVEPRDPGFPEGDVLLYQGGIYAEVRAFEATISALRLLPEVSLAVVGFGRAADIELVQRWAAEQGVAERVHLFPAVPFDQLVGIAASATVGIVPLRNDGLNSWLGDTNKLFEYLMAGLPVVGSDFPEVAAALRAGSPRVGEVFDPEDPRSIADAVRRVIDHDYADRRREARRLAIELYRWEVEEANLHACYDGLALPRRPELAPLGTP